MLINEPAAYPLRQWDVGRKYNHMKNDFERIFEFTIELDRLKAILRKTKPSGLDRYENTAEHSWQVSNGASD
ncbi:hypothetical protein B1757_10265 [Acidithiobacillus marinus]|uniref:Uncharacterized protein n=1 Tax=Acidithiobacillus marinus TaxID=187490 RepID=A0A2I1DKC5_9PROT|nr:hypothetical protein B1757_10265 [Acidithiobacillus marinus]